MFQPLKWSVQAALFPSQLWAMWILKSMAKMKHALPQLDFKRVAVEFDNLILTKYHGLKTVFETAEFDNLTLVSNACASSNQLTKCKK